MQAIWIDTITKYMIFQKTGKMTQYQYYWIMEEGKYRLLQISFVITENNFKPT